MKIIKVDPIGERPGQVIIGARLREVAVPIYPSSPEGERFRKHRIAWGVSLRTAAKLLGLRAEELSALEHGKARLSTAEEWEEIIRTFDHKTNEMAYF